ncbi:hypothetical protein ACH4F6_37700 [Streptomyces sp. NPDC017936]|uniref:hypothetical protein n=1 Tax=Streptomyces sp. NPDC017936 TaxID=3365016 RepID=UPI0037B2DC58
MSAKWTDQRLVRVDRSYDLERASDGFSRFGEYLRLNASLFRDAWRDEPAPVKDPAEFAVHAWRVATSPVMAPGYVRCRPDLHGVTLHRDDYDHALYAEVRVPLRHHHLYAGEKKFPYAWQDWEAERYDAPFPELEEPRETKRPAVLASAVVRVPGGEWSGLVTPSAYEGRTLTNEAMETVSIVVQYVNEDAGPIVERLLS